MSKCVSDTIYETLSSMVGDLASQDKKQHRKNFKTICCTFIIKSDLRVKTSKLVQNYVCTIPYSFSKYLGSVLAFGDDALHYCASYGNKVVNGADVDCKKLKKSIRWCVFTDEKHIASMKNVLLKKGMLLNNYKIIYNMLGLQGLVNSILSGSSVKVFRANNQVSCLVGDISMQHSYIVDNVMSLLNFINDNIGKVRIISMHRSMCRSYRINL